MRLLILTCAVIFVHCVVCYPASNSDLKYEGNMPKETIQFILIQDTDERNNNALQVKGNNIICTDEDAKMWSYDFHSCFMERKYQDGGRDLNTIVDRILDHSNDCIKKSSRKCRPDQEGFMIIMNKVIHEIKDYSFMYLESIFHDREKVKDLKCVESILSNETYQNCFDLVLHQDYSLKVFKGDVESAILCTNKSNKKCSKAAKTSLNRMVRNILGVEQPLTENIEDDPKPEPPKMWYDRYIIEPIVNLWKSIRSFFGF